MGKAWVKELKELLSLRVNGEIVEALKELQRELKSNNVSMSFDSINFNGIIWDIRIDDMRIFISEDEVGRTDKPILNKVDENYNPVEIEYISVLKEKLENIILQKLKKLKGL